MIACPPRVRAGRDAAARARAARAFLVGLAACAAGIAAGCAPHVSRAELARRIAEGSAPPILDVRSGGEYAAAHVPGAVHIPFYSVWSRSDEIPAREGEPLVVYCEHGPRAGLARAGLWIAGAGEVRFLEGHMTAWKADGLPVEPPAADPPREADGSQTPDD